MRTFCDLHQKVQTFRQQVEYKNWRSYAIDCVGEMHGLKRKRTRHLIAQGEIAVGDGERQLANLSELYFKRTRFAAV